MGGDESNNYEINVSPMDIHSGELKAPDKPHIFVIDELKIGDNVFNNLVAVDTHGHVRDGDWTAKNNDSQIDIVDLVKEIYSHGHKIDILLMCAQYDYFGSYNISDPPPEYYSFLNENNIAYSKPSNIVVPRLKMDQNGKISGYLFDTNTFENLNKMTVH